MGEAKPVRGRPRGFGAFATIWASQIFSILTSGMTGFALTIWMYERTKSATAMAAVQVFYIVPFLVMSFFAGPMVDRYKRRLTLAISDVLAAVGTLAVLIAHLAGGLELWMIYASAMLLGIGNSFQWPAFSATISLMVPKEQLGRANGMTSLMEAGPAVFAPILAGAIMPLIGLGGILALDIATFVVAVGTLFFVEIPEPPRSLEGKKAEGNIFKEAVFGFKYIFERPSLLGLQLLLLGGNLFSGIGMAVAAPMVLARSGGSSLNLGGVQTAAAIGAVGGGILMSVWGGFKQRTRGLLVGWIIQGIAGGLCFGLGGSFWLWALGLAVASAAAPLVNGSNQAIWQSKVPPDMQGRVFSARRLIAWVSNPLTPLIAGPLADFVLEPAMAREGSLLSSLLGPALGRGPGVGMGILIALSGIATVAVVLAAWAFPVVRNAERILPDHDSGQKPEAEAGAPAAEAESTSGAAAG